MKRNIRRITNICQLRPHNPPAQHPLELIAEDFDTKFVLSGDAPDLVVPTSQPELHILLSLLSHMLQTWHTPNAFRAVFLESVSISVVEQVVFFAL